MSGWVNATFDTSHMAEEDDEDALSQTTGDDDYDEKGAVTAAISSRRASFIPLDSRAYRAMYQRVTVGGKPTNYVKCIRCNVAILRYATTVSAHSSSLRSHMQRCTSAAKTRRDTRFDDGDPIMARESMKKAVLDFFCVEGLPFDLVESPAFRELIKQAMLVGSKCGVVEANVVASRRTLVVSKHV